MDGALGIITAITIILLIGIIMSIISNKLKVSEILFLMVIGIVLSYLTYAGNPVFEFSEKFLVAMSILAISLIVFDGSSRFKIKEFDELSFTSLKLIGIFMGLSIIIIGLLSSLFFYPQFTAGNFLLCAIFASLVAATDAPSVLAMLKNKSSKVLELMKIESILNTPLSVLIPVILLDLKKNLASTSIMTTFLDQIKPFLLKIVAGIGAGLLIGLVVFKIMKKVYNEKLSPLALLVSALLAYVIAEHLGGNGVLAVAVLGLLFGNTYLKQKENLAEFSSIFSNSLEILIFVLIGVVIRLPTDFVFYIKAFSLFGILIVIRYFSLLWSTDPDEVPTKTRVFAALMMPKGIAVAVVALTFTSFVTEIPGLEIVLHLTLVFMLFSLILATVCAKFSSKFLPEAPLPAKEGTQ